MSLSPRQPLPGSPLSPPPPPTHTPETLQNLSVSHVPRCVWKGGGIFVRRSNQSTLREKNNNKRQNLGPLYAGEHSWRPACKRHQPCAPPPPPPQCILVTPGSADGPHSGGRVGGNPPQGALTYPCCCGGSYSLWCPPNFLQPPQPRLLLGRGSALWRGGWHGRWVVGTGPHA